MGPRTREIITTPMTCIATNTSVVRNPGLGSSGPMSIRWTGNIDPDEIEPLITNKTKAIMMVHWGGNPCDIDRICEIARTHGIPVIEDAAHALGATYRRATDRSALGLRGIFVPGDQAGDQRRWRLSHLQARRRTMRAAVCCDGSGIDRDHPMPVDLRCEIDVAEAGYKFHMNDVAAAIGRENLKHLDWILIRHRGNAGFLR